MDEDILLCAICRKGEEGGALSKCYATGYRTLLSNAEILAKTEMKARIDEQWERGKLRVHQACREHLKNELRVFLRNDNLNSLCCNAKFR